MLPLRYLTVVATAIAVASASFFMPQSASAGGSCHPGSGVSTERGTLVTMSENCFIATVLRVNEGATVTFLNEDPVVHAVTGVAWTWGDETPIAEGESVQHVFDENGVYVYTCLLHPGMAGAIIVGDGAATLARFLQDDPAGTGAGSPSLPQSDSASDLASTSDDAATSTVLLPGAIIVGVVLLIAIAAVSMAFGRASANRRPTIG